jgi:hypothetical protein
MPFQEINRFLIAGAGPGGADVTYIVTADYDKKEIFTYNDPNPQAVGPTVDAATLGFTQGDTVNSRCVGTTLEYITALYNYPYAQFETPVPNSPICGYTPPSCDIDYTTSVTDAVNGANNGKITANVATNPLSLWKYLFSLDGITYQDSNIFANLFPGNYTLWIKQVQKRAPYSTICIVHKNLTVANNVIPNSVFTPIPYKDSKDLCWFFRLIIDGDIHAISEPIGWGDVNMKGERDMEFHGYQFQYTDGQTKMKFDCAAGKDLINAEYEANGGDGEVLFQFGYTYKGDDYVLFKGKLMLHTLNTYAGWVECTVESDTFDSTFQSRLEVAVSMARSTTYDNTSILPPTPYDLELHAKETQSQFKNTNTNRISYSDYSYPEDSNGSFYIMPDISAPSANDLLQSNTFVLQSSPGLPMTDSLWVHKFDNPGRLNLSLNWAVDVVMKINNKNLITGGTFDAYMVFLHRKFNAANNSFTDIRTVISSVNTQSFPAFSNQARDFSLSGSKTLADYNVEVNDEIYFFLQIDVSKTVYIAFVDVQQASIDYSAELLENAGSSQANVWFLDDALKHIIRVITDNKYVFKSKFFERLNSGTVVDGPASKRVLTNGFQIRRFSVNDKPLQVDLKTLLSSLNAQNCIGLNYTTDQNGFSFVRMERRDFFYQDREILAIEEVADYSESVATEIIYNEYEIGYKTYQTDGFNSLDEFNTKQTGLTPVKKNPKKLSQLAELITSGYALETSRRIQFQEKPTDSATNDDSPFMIAVKRDSTGWVTEKNESFSTVDNLISPQTSYNIRLSPRRMLFNWFIWLKGIFVYKDTAEEIISTTCAQNGVLATQFDAGETDVIGDLDKSLITENGSIPLTALASTPDIYRPEWASFTCRLTPDKVQIINAALTGAYGSTKDYGYLMVKKPDGVWQAGWVYNLGYNWWTQKLTIKMLKKFYSPLEPQAGDCCEWLVANGCYILANAEKLIA